MSHMKHWYVPNLSYKVAHLFEARPNQTERTTKVHYTHLQSTYSVRYDDVLIVY